MQASKPELGDGVEERDRLMRIARLGLVAQADAAGPDRLVERAHDQRQPGVARHPVAEGDHFGEILFGVDVHQRHRRLFGEERLLREAQHDGGILAAGKQ